jgi:hypothetical protein
MYLQSRWKHCMNRCDDRISGFYSQYSTPALLTGWCTRGGAPGVVHPAQNIIFHLANGKKTRPPGQMKDGSILSKLQKETGPKMERF